MVSEEEETRVARGAGGGLVAEEKLGGWWDHRSEVAGHSGVPEAEGTA